MPNTIFMTFIMYDYPLIKSKNIRLESLSTAYRGFQNDHTFQFEYNLAEKSQNYKEAYFNYFDGNSMIVDLWDA